MNKIINSKLFCINCIHKLKDLNLIYQGTLPKPKGKSDSEWEAREQLLFKSTQYGDDTDRPLQKSDESWTYFAADAAYLEEKIARKFDDTNPILCASPEFIKQYGPFTHPSQLEQVPWVSIGSRDGHNHNTNFIHNESNESIEVKPNSGVKVNHHEVALHHILA